MKRVIFLQAARRELSASIQYYDLQLEGIGSRFLQEVERAVRSISGHSNAGSPLPGDFRKWVVSGFPFSLVHTRWDDLIVLTAVAHHHPRPDYWRTRINPE